MRQVLELVGLWERRKSEVGTFSGGMKRRLEIARGLLHSPSVLFLDEPTVGLDPQTRASIWEYLDQLRREEDITIFLTTHYMDEAEYCDRIAIIDAGQIVALDTPLALKAQIATDRVRLTTADDERAAEIIRERFDLEPLVEEDAITAARGRRRGLRARAPRRPRGRREQRQRVPAVPRRRVHGLHRPNHPRRRRPARTRCLPCGGVADDDHRPRPHGRPPRGWTVAPVAERPRASAPTARRQDRHRTASSSGSAADRGRLLTGLVQPFLFLFVLGAGLSSVVSAGLPGVDFQTFLFPGVLCTSVLFTGVFAGVSIVWDREFGFLREMLVAPIRRSSILIGKCLGGALVATGQGLIVLLCGGLVGVPYSPVLFAELLGILFLVALAVCALGMFLGAKVRDMQALMPIIQLAIMPMMFLSGAMYPIGDLPSWLLFLTKINPLTYAVQPMRHLVLDAVGVSAAENATLNPPITWFGWAVPIPLQVLMIAVLGFVILVAAIKRFSAAD